MFCRCLHRRGGPSQQQTWRTTPLLCQVTSTGCFASEKACSLSRGHDRHPAGQVCGSAQGGAGCDLCGTVQLHCTAGPDSGLPIEWSLPIAQISWQYTSKAAHCSWWSVSATPAQLMCAVLSLSTFVWFQPQALFQSAFMMFRILNSRPPPCEAHATRAASPPLPRRWICEAHRSQERQLAPAD